METGIMELLEIDLITESLFRTLYKDDQALERVAFKSGNLTK